MSLDHVLKQSLSLIESTLCNPASQAKYHCELPSDRMSQPVGMSWSEFSNMWTGDRIYKRSCLIRVSNKVHWSFLKLESYHLFSPRFPSVEYHPHWDMFDSKEWKGIIHSPAPPTLLWGTYLEPTVVNPLLSSNQSNSPGDWANLDLPSWSQHTDILKCFFL